MTESFVVSAAQCPNRVLISSRIDPLSLQSIPSRKRPFMDALRDAVSASTTDFFTHDVEVTLVWFIEEDRRYRTHLVADLDNVLKPMIDAVTGANGILIDDNQVQSIKASWMTPGTRGVGFDLEVTALAPDDHVQRQGSIFVEFSADRCYLLPGAASEFWTTLVGALGSQLESHDRLLETSGDPYLAASLLPIVRPFPRARLGQFRVRHHSDFA